MWIFYVHLQKIKNIMKIIKKLEIKCDCHNTSIYKTDFGNFCLIEISKIINMQMSFTRDYIKNELIKRENELFKEINEKIDYLYIENKTIFVNNKDMRTKNLIKMIEIKEQIKLNYE